MIDQNKIPKIISIRADNGEHSHFRLIDTTTGKILWEESSECDYTDNCANLKHGACTTCKRLYKYCTGDWFKPLTQNEG